MVRKKPLSDAEEINRFDDKIEGLIKKKQDYIRLCDERAARRIPQLRKHITNGLKYVHKRLELIKRWESKIREYEERIKVLELQAQDRRKVIQTAQEEMRRFNNEPGVSKLLQAEREKPNE